MVTTSPVVQQNGAAKIKRPVPPGIQTNGIASSNSSPSPSMSAKKPPTSAKQAPNSASDRSITASTVRPVNRARRENSSQAAGRNSRNSAGMRTGSFSVDAGAKDDGPPPYVVTSQYILSKHSGKPPSLVVHLHATHFRFDGQVGMFPYKSPMGKFIEHLRARTLPHDILEYLIEAKVPFYDGCLIVQIHDHKSLAQTTKAVTKASRTSNAVLPSSIHNYNQCLTPSPYVPFPKEEQVTENGIASKDTDNSKQSPEEEKDKESVTAPTQPPESTTTKEAAKPKIFTAVLHPTPESLQADLKIKATTPKGDGKGVNDTPSLAPPSTPLSLVPPTPTASSMPPPANKRQKKERMELDSSTIYAAEGQILLATTAPLILEPTRNPEETILLLEAMAHPKHSEPPPQPKTRKRTVAEMAADEAAAADQERYMLVLDDRLSGNTSGAQGSSATDGEAQTNAAAFEPRFERFKVIEDIKRDHAEKKEQEKIKQQENDRRLQLQRQEQLLQAQRQQAEAERQRREAVLKENQMRQEAQRQQLAARSTAAAAAQSQQQQQNQQTAQKQQQQQQQQQQQKPQSQPQPQPQQQPPQQQQQPQPQQTTQHAHPAQNGITGNISNGVPAGGQSAMANNMQGAAQPRFPAQMTQAAAASSPVIRQGTPLSSPMVGSVPMQQTNSNIATSPPRPPSAVQNGQMSVPMAHNMSGRGSQQSHPSGTPRMPNSTPNMPHGTPINRQTVIATPRMTHASPPPNMVAHNSQMGMMNQQGMNQHNPQIFAQMAAQQRAIAQQQQQQMAAMQNGGANAGLNPQGMTPQQQQMMQMVQRQMMLQQQQQQAQQQQHQQQQQGGMMTPQQQQQFAQQYNQARQGQMTAQMQAQLQQMARMGQINNPMQRQVSGQMMNGSNANMQAFAAMQMQQAQQQQQQQHHPQQMGQTQPQQMGANPIQAQIQINARQIYSRLMQGAVAKFGSAENVPQDTLDKMKQSSLLQAQQMLQQSMVQRRAQQQQMMLQQQQQQAAMQGMGGMMGHPGM
ncbi:hypothetical protein MANI_007853 [Metarhizium anisopliae]